MIGDDSVKVKFDRRSEVTGKLVLSGGVCPFCGESKLTFVSMDKDKDRLTVCLACKRRIAIINSDSIQNFDRLFPEIYKIV
jgi:transcription elongation factor Elf1